MSAILAVLSVCVPCAYSTIGRAPLHATALPVGTINAPEAVADSAFAPTVQYFT